jgi:cell division protein FtsB
MRIVKWSSTVKEGVSLRLARGADAESIKASFGKMVDEIASNHQDPKKLNREIAKLRKELEELKSGKPKKA